MPVEISTELRLLVATRAKYRCEYCLFPQAVALHKHEPDHIIPIQHGGSTTLENLALACLRCNRYKGPNVGSFDPETKILKPFFDPRREIWFEHFELVGSLIAPKTANGRVTVKLFRFNDPERVAEREKLMRAGLYSM